MSRILELFGEEIAGVDDAGNVSNTYDFCMMGFTHAVLVEVEMFGAFAGASGGPVHRCFVAVVNRDGVVRIGDAKVDSAVFDVKKLDNAGVGGNNFSLARGARSLFVADGFPSDGAAGAADDKARQGAEFEHFKGSALLDGVAKLATPACITEGGEVRAIGRSGGRRCVGVRFLVMVVWEMIKRLDS